MLETKHTRWANNSGKTSILDALRILESCLRHAKTSNPVIIEIEIQDEYFRFSLANITHNYHDDDSIIEFRGSNKVRAVIKLHPERQTKFYLIPDGLRVKSSSKFRNAWLVTACTSSLSAAAVGC